jgi:hypothetical protein
MHKIHDESETVMQQQQQQQPHQYQAGPVKGTMRLSNSTLRPAV